MQSVFGTWRLVRVVTTGPDGEPLPPGFGGAKAMGRVVLGADGRMMAMTADGRTSIPEGETREYSTYTGNYTFDGKQLVTRVDAASDPARIGSDQVRDVRFEGNYMVLRPPLRAYGGTMQQRELYWEKISDI